jgi:hypothetical protein
MRTIIRLEEFAFFILSIYVFSLIKMHWWLFPVLLFVPDISMVGYLGGNRLGAILYNIVHFRGLSIFLAILGFIAGNSFLALAGTILFAHSSMDRAMGYGMKLQDGFGYTHLGRIGRSDSE